MSDIERLLDEEAKHAETHKDAPAKPGTKVSRPGHARSTVYSVRLNADEVTALQRIADEAHLPASTLVRSWIVERLQAPSGDVIMLDERRLRRAVREETERAVAKAQKSSATKRQGFGDSGRVASAGSGRAAKKTAARKTPTKKAASKKTTARKG